MRGSGSGRPGRASSLVSVVQSPDSGLLSRDGSASADGGCGRSALSCGRKTLVPTPGAAATRRGMVEKGFLTYDEIAAALEEVELTKEQIGRASCRERV